MDTLIELVQLPASTIHLHQQSTISLLLNRLNHLNRTIGISLVEVTEIIKPLQGAKNPAINSLLKEENYYHHTDDLAREGAVMRKKFKKHRKVDLQD